jgi:nicotinamidase/pyrazinamidase
MKTVFFDVDTQLDFLYPAGALAVPGAESIVGALGEVTRFAAANKFQIVSTADAHTEDDPEFKIWKPHCVAETFGQQKAACTLLKDPRVLSTASGALIEGMEEAPQIIVEKQMLDCFTNPNLRPLLQRLAADRYVVYGVVSEYCVQCAAFGLLETGAKVELVSDAVKSLNASAERDMLERFQAQGGKITTVARVII